VKETQARFNRCKGQALSDALIAPTLGAMRGLCLLAVAIAAIGATSAIAASSAPAPYAAVRACLKSHKFTITHEAHGPSFGWRLDASIPWKLNGGTGHDDAIVVVATTLRDAKAYEARLARLLRAVYTGEGSDKVSNYLHRNGRVVYGWGFRPESSTNQRTLALCAAAH
jgi:hypothetical protein